MTDYESYQPIQRFAPTLSLSPDGSEVLYSTNISGQYNLVRQPFVGGVGVQLTDYADNAVRNAAWTPDGKSIVYAADRDGDEFQQIYLQSDAGETTALTNAPQVQHELGISPLSRDGRYLLYAGNDRDPATRDVLVRNLHNGDIRRLDVGSGSFYACSLSPDGSHVLVLQLHNTGDSDLLLVPAGGGPAHNTTAHEGHERNEPGPWAADGSGFWFTTTLGREFMGISFYEVATHTTTRVATPDWDVNAIAYAAGGRRLVWVVNEDGMSRLTGIDLDTGAGVTLPDIPIGVIAAIDISEDGMRLAILHGTATRPRDIATVDLVSGEFRYLTNSRPDGLPDGVDATLIRYPTHDGRDIPAWLYRPVGDGPFPVLLSIHGGPSSQELPTYAYSGLYQYLLSRGIGVLAPNVRGSTGYGKSYQQLINRDWGGAELRDFECAVRYLRTLGWVDPARLAVYGASFGGFATLSCISRLPDLWAAAVSVVGPSNLVTFAKAVPPTWRPFIPQSIGDPDTETDFLLERSPITYADQIRTPLFVIQGAKDPRVVQAESDQIVESLRNRGVEVRYDVYPDEGHGFTRRRNELKAFGDIAELLIARLN